MEILRSYLAERIVVAVGDICDFHGDAIVNAANSSLAGGGGVDGAIHRAAGALLGEECKALRQTSLPDGLPAGKAVLTGAGKLPLKGIIHAVGPIWRDGNADEARLLASAYRSSLALAAKQNWDLLAIPAISTGVYGYPKNEAAGIALNTAREFLKQNEHPKQLWLVFFNQNDARFLMSQAERLGV
jgi:O-acetyl-ADP-ribose deacetylase